MSRADPGGHTPIDVARVRRLSLRGAALVLTAAVGLTAVGGVASADPITPTLVQAIDTFAWSPPSPDPMGIAYDPTSNRLLVSDSEVEEMTIWQGANFFESSTTGTLLRTGNTTSFNNEPTDVAFNPANGHVFFSDDNQRRIFEVTRGADGVVGTSDDTRTSFSTSAFGATDPEGLAYGAGSLFVAGGGGRRIYRVQPGQDGIFNGVSPSGDDQISSFDTNPLNQLDPEGVEYNADSGTLFICSRDSRVVVEATLSGALVRSMDMTFTGIRKPSGLAYAPTSNNAGRRSLYITDRAVDNDSNPNENDGRIYEVSIATASSPANNPPVVTNPGAQSDAEGESVTLQIQATDADGDTLTYDATGLPPGLSISASNGRITGTVAAGAAANSPYSARVTVSDGQASDTEAFAWTITAAPPVNDPPVVTNPGAQSDVEGEPVNLPIQATDGNGDTLSFSAAGLPAGLSIDPSTGVISGTVAVGAAANSPYSSQVTASDGQAGDTETFTWTISPPEPLNNPPVVTNPGAQSDAEGEAVSLQVQAADVDGDPLTYGASGLPPGLSISATTGVITGTVATGAAANSPYSTQVTASDGAAVDGETFTWTITDASVPAAPQGLTIDAQTTALILDWANSPESDLAGYNVYRSIAAGGTFVRLNGAPLSSSAYTDGDAPAGATSFYRVTAVDSAGNESEPASASKSRSSIVFIGTSSARGNVGTLTLARPGGITEGDLLLAAIAVRGAPTVSAPSGWTVVQQNVTPSNSLRQIVFSRTATASEPSAYSFTFSARRGAVGLVVAYRGVGSIGPSGGQANASSTSITAPSLTTAVADSAEIGFFGIASGSTITPPGGMTERGEIARTSGGTGTRVAIEVADDVVDAGALDAATALASKPGENIGQLIVLWPAS